MTLARELFDHMVRYRRLRRFTALGARRFAAARTYRRHAVAQLRRQSPPGPGWDEIAGFRIRHLGAEWMRYLYREVFAQQMYWFSSTSRTPEILDCGGNIGMSTLFFKALYPDAHVSVFEPAPWACEAMEQTFRANGIAGVTVHNVALAERDGRATLHHDTDDPGSALMSTTAGFALAATSTVPAVRLSAYVDGPVDFMKVDIEGDEMGVLREMAEADKLRFVQQIALEYHHHLNPADDKLAECLALLEQQGFGYQLIGQVYTPITRGQFQGLMIHAYRKQH